MQTECNDTPICPIRLPYFSYRTKTSIRQVQLKKALAIDRKLILLYWKIVKVQCSPITKHPAKRMSFVFQAKKIPKFCAKIKCII
jgi:hypothetical protein